MKKRFIFSFLFFVLIFSLIIVSAEENEPVSLIEPIEDIFIPRNIPFEIDISYYFDDDYFDIEYLDVETPEIDGLIFVVDELYLYVVITDGFVNGTSFKFSVSDGPSKVSSNEIKIYEVILPDGDSYLDYDFYEDDLPLQGEGVINGGDNINSNNLGNSFSCEAAGGVICSLNELCDGSFFEENPSCCNGACVNLNEARQGGGLKFPNFFRENWLIIVIVIGGILILGLIIFLIFYFISKVRSGSKKNNEVIKKDPVKNYIENLGLGK